MRIAVALLALASSIASSLAAQTPEELFRSGKYEDARKAFAERVATHSRGAVTDFKVLSQPARAADGTYSVTIEANVAKFTAPASARRLKVSLEPVRDAAHKLEVLLEERTRLGLPAGATILADWGADLVKVAPPGGDPFRGLAGACGGDHEPPVELADVAVDLEVLGEGVAHGAEALRRAQRAVLGDGAHCDLIRPGVAL